MLRVGARLDLALGERGSMNHPGEESTLDGTFPRYGIGNPPHEANYPNPTIETLHERRSIRRFLPDAIDPDVLDAIVDTGLHAANAGGCQAPIFLVSQDKETNELLGRISNSLYDEGYYPVSKSQPSTASGAGIKSGFYGAPVVITVFTPKDWGYAMADAAMAASNMMNAAWSLGIGSCFVSRATRTMATPEGRRVMKESGIPDDYEAQLHVVLGYPESTARDAHALYPNRVAWI